jgi:hypothetical protein
MYLVRDKKSKKIIHVNPAPLSQDLKEKEVYYKFDQRTMEIGRTDRRLPEHFEIDKEGIINELSLEEQVKRKIITLSEDEAIIDNQMVKIPKDMKVVTIGDKKEIVPLTLVEKKDKGILKLNEPFEFINESENKIERRTVFDVINQDLVKTKEDLKKAEEAISSGILREISKSFSRDLEIKLIKDNMDWITDGQPENDPRRARYVEMQKDIAAIKKKYEPLKQKLKAMEFDKKPKKK